MTPERRPADVFSIELRRLREIRGLSQKKLASKIEYDASYISKIEGGTEPPTQGFAQAADKALNSGGTLERLWRQHRRAGRQTQSDRAPRRPVEQDGATAQGLVVLDEDALLYYDDGTYHVRVRRHLSNGSSEPISRYLVRVAVDRYPDTPDRSNRLYRSQPLTMDELGFVAECDEEPMSCEIKHDRDAFKEIWLLFENEHGRFPLYPGHETWIEYRYAVSAEKWGSWFQRAVRVPTNRLNVQIDLPVSLEPVIWGLETSLSADLRPFRTAIAERDDGDRRIYSWSAEEPALHTRFRFEWRFKNEAAADPKIPASERMRRLGILQSDNPVLRQICEPFDLPAEAAGARALGELLVAYLEPIRAAHVFSKGMGLAAPQIGVCRAAAVVELPGERPQVLYNPRIVAESEETDDQFEGCLSFFDVRGTVRRPLTISVQHQALDGQLSLIEFELGAARLWAHEIDHLNGTLYADRLVADTNLVPVEQYVGVGETWRYT